jgi:tetratricopeptide (TPR) repeat protein
MASDSGDCYLALAKILEKIGRFEEAISNYRRVVNLQSDNATAYGRLGWLLSQKEQWQEAINYLEKAVNLDPAMPLGIYEALGKAFAACSGESD